MAYPETQTVESLLNFLNESLASGKVTKDTKVFVEVFLLSREETILKDNEDILGYHVPDEVPFDVVNFSTGRWECGRVAEHTVSLTCYLRPGGGAVTKEQKTRLQHHIEGFDKK